MPKKDSTLIAIVLDRSGSMQSVKAEVIGGFNKLIEDNRQVPGECLVTLVQFDDTIEFMYEAQPVAKAPLLTEDTYEPRAFTRLFDAIGVTIARVGADLAKRPDSERPDKVLVIVLTDGAENASREYKGQQVRQMIEHQRTKYQWEFAFHGCDEQALAQAVAIGIAPQNVMANQGGQVGTSKALRDMSEGSIAYRGGGSYSQN